MTTYFDSSAVLRIVLGSRDALPGWKRIEHGVASALMEVECLRTLDRLRLVEKVAAKDLAARREAVYEFARRIDVVEITQPVLSRASQPLPVPLKTLDAIHLATAMLWRESEGELEIATHDEALALAARALGFTVTGS